MNNEQLLTYIQNPGLLTEQTLSTLSGELEKHPYCSTLHTLLLKNCKISNNASYPEQLKQSIFYIPNRKLLFEYINAPKIEEVEIVDAGNIRREELDDLQQNIASILQQQVEQGKNPTVFENQIIPEINFELDESAEIVLRGLEDTPISENSFGKKGANEVILQLDDENAKAEESSLNTILKDDIAEEKPVFDTHDIELISSESPSSDNITENRLNEDHTFTTWFDYLTEDIKIDKVESDKEEKAVSGGDNKFSLIDKFLDENPRIAPPKKVDENQEDISVASVEEHDDLITDTLAHIYLKQGYYEKAILTYEKLSLKFPEKSTYFASQIKEIKSLLNKS
jgi:hypothetical protein